MSTAAKIAATVLLAVIVGFTIFLVAFSPSEDLTKQWGGHENVQPTWLPLWQGQYPGDL